MSERFKIVVAFATVYIFWGSTYLAIRVGAQLLPATFFAAARFLPGGLLLLIALAVLGRKVWPARGDWPALLAAGVLLLVTGNGLVIFAERTVPSGLAALVIATTPLWIAGLEAILSGGERLSARGIAGIVLGLAGLIVLSWPELSANGDQVAAPWGILVLALAAFSWSSGTLVMRRRPTTLHPLAVTGWQMLLAGLVHAGLAFALQRGEPATFNLTALAAVAYLIVFGSWLGFGAFVWLVAHVPPAKVSTYAYVNPVIAVFLGWLILHERVDAYVLGGTGIILLAVVLVTTARVRVKPPLGAPAPAAVPAADPVNPADCVEGPCG